jgi:hypothetical protein
MRWLMKVTQRAGLSRLSAEQYEYLTWQDMQGLVEVEQVSERVRWKGDV